jgi:hypothetical protein
MFLLILIIFILWMLNLEINPTLGKVWLRPDHNGNLIFCPQNLILFLIKPFQNIWLWEPRFWDINFYTFFIICFLVYNYIIEFMEIHNSLIKHS